MSIYNALYGRDGHGVGPNEPEKKGFARFCQMVGRDLGQLLGTNLMVCVLCLPAAWVLPIPENRGLSSPAKADVLAFARSTPCSNEDVSIPSSTESAKRFKAKPPFCSKILYCKFIKM